MKKQLFYIRICVFIMILLLSAFAAASCKDVFGNASYTESKTDGLLITELVTTDNTVETTTLSYVSDTTIATDATNTTVLTDATNTTVPTDTTNTTVPADTTKAESASNDEWSRYY